MNAKEQETMQEEIEQVVGIIQYNLEKMDIDALF
jgi:hypothetical protein